MIKTEAYNESTQFLGLTTKNGFKAGKLYTQKPLSAADAFVVDRNLAAYRINQSGVLELMAANVPRVDYKNGCPEILIENEATNRILQSNNFASALWGKINLTNASGLLTTTATNTACYIAQNSAGGFVSGSTYTLSFSGKKGTANFIQLLFSGGQTVGNAFANFDLNNGTASLGSGISVSIELEDDFYRCSLTYVSNVSGSNDPIIWFVNSLSSTRAESFTGAIGSTLTIKNAQQELGLFPTSYIPTTTTIVTRPPDIIENNTINYDINQATIFVRARLDFSTDPRGIITLYDGGPFENYITIYSEIIGAVKKIVFQTYTDPDENKYELTVPSNGIYNMAFAYDLTANTYAIAVNGNIEFSGTFAISPPTSSELTTLTLGRIGSFYDARVIGSMFFDSKLDNTSLENLTA
jgi:hypothetical protein